MGGTLFTLVSGPRMIAALKPATIKEVVAAGKARYTVEVSANGFAAEQKTVEIEADERVDLSFQLAPAGK